MKKALVVTTQYVYNYGAVLQAYGFHAFLKQQGWQHDFLSLIPDDARLFDPVLPLGRESIHRLVRNARKLPLYAQMKRRRARFDSFVNGAFPQTQRFANQEEVLRAELNYDLYVTGGDQMFNRSCIKRPVNLLEFGNPAAPRISYSTSIGSAKFSAEEKATLLHRLSRYEEISLREESMLSFFDASFPRRVRCDLDGSMLIDCSVWDKVAVPVQGMPEKYILVYELLPHPDLQRAVAAAREKLKLPVVVIKPDGRTSIHADYLVMDAGPGEFLTLFRNSTAVVTTSFHGTCFSVIFHKPFLSLIRQNETRINNLLDTFELSAHYCQHFTAWPEGMSSYEKAEAMIEKGRSQAYQYLARYWHE
ncbi:MAG: polysaccharide pyruvyl transferase family protein [Aristaeellaceae bacterium]